jgi:hypothetical protein
MKHMLNRRDLVAGGAAAFAASALPVQAAETIQWSTLAAIDYLVPLIAKDAGLFGKQGLDVAMQIATQAPALLPAVVGGALQIGVSTGIQVAIANEAGLDVAIIAAAGLLKRLQIRQAAGQGGDQFVPHTPTGSWAFTGSASSRAIPVGSLMSRHSKVGPMNSSV